jgi:hypothetical protein
MFSDWIRWNESSSLACTFPILAIPNENPIMANDDGFNSAQLILRFTDLGLQLLWL